MKTPMILAATLSLSLAGTVAQAQTQLQSAAVTVDS